ncbi:MAG: recombinase family protein, partial [Acidobacteriota bacterium]
MRAALYMRRSTNEVMQADSLRAQEEVLRAYAAEHQHEILSVFAESASGRTVDGRSEFQRLIRTVRGNPRFELILVCDVSRWGRFDSPDEAGYYEWVCLSHGVPVVYINESFEGDGSPLAALQKSMKRWMAGEFSREKSRTVQRSQARVVKLGFMHGGPPPYALRRILVDREGTYIGELRPGDHKALSNMRVKLAAGETQEVEVVRRVFHMYADEKLTVKDIAKRLNAEGLRGARGGLWQPVSVAYVLSNASYVGESHYTLRNRNSKSELLDLRGDPGRERRITTKGAYEAIVDQDLWDRVQLRHATRTWRKTDRDLANELRQAYERWGFVESKMVTAPDDHACWETYANRFRHGYTEALETAYASEVNDAKLKFQALVAAHFDVQDFEEGWLLDTLLHVGYKVAWPRAWRGGLFWEFEYRGNEAEDVTIGFAFTPP